MMRLAVALLALALLAAPLTVEAQPAKIPRIGYIGNGDATTGGPTRDAFRQGLRELGWIEGQTVTIEYRWAERNPDRLPALAAELVQAKVDVIVLSGTPAIRAARGATSTIPIVFVSLADPVTLGVVANLARPGGNMTGVASQFEELITKQLQLLKETVPNISRVALLHHAEIAPTVLSEADTAARRLGLTARAVKATGKVEFESVFMTIRSERAEAIQVLPSPFFNAHRGHLIELVAKHRPARDLRIQGLRARWGAHVLRPEHRRDAPGHGQLRRSNPQGRQAWRPSDRACDEVRAGHQPQRVGDIMLTSLCARFC
jgi:ABC-type uncharacterized transport system substrate-binding protein